MFCSSRVIAMDLQMCRAQLSDSAARPAIHCQRQESSAIRWRCPRLARLTELDKVDWAASLVENRAAPQLTAFFGERRM